MSTVSKAIASAVAGAVIVLLMNFFGLPEEVAKSVGQQIGEMIGAALLGFGTTYIAPRNTKVILMAFLLLGLLAGPSFAQIRRPSAMSPHEGACYLVYTKARNAAVGYCQAAREYGKSDCEQTMAQEGYNCVLCSSPAGKDSSACLEFKNLEDCKGHVYDRWRGCMRLYDYHFMRQCKAERDESILQEKDRCNEWDD